MEEKPLPKSIPLCRLIGPFIFILTLAGWATVKLTDESVEESANTTLSRLLMQQEIRCEWPKFSIWDHHQLRNKTFVRSVECSSQPSFASLESDGLLTIAKPVSSENLYEDVKCYYAAISVSPSGELQFGQEHEMLLNSRMRAHHEQLVVRCRSEDGETVYEEAFFNPTARITLPIRGNRDAPQYAASDKMNPSIAMIILDDVSQAHFARNLPKTMRLMMDEDFFMPSRYSQSFSDSASNLEMLLRGNGSTSIVETMKARGCLSFSNEELLSEEDEMELESADISTRALHRFNLDKHQNGHCLSNGKSLVSSVFSPLLSFSSSFRSLCTVSTSRLRSPRDRAQLGAIDEELSSSLARLLSTSANTAIFLVSPSGLRGNGLSGVVEGKSPLLAAWFPLEFRKSRNKHYSAFAWNMDKLFTTRDLHETLHNLAAGDLPKDVLWREWDEEQNQVTSLLGEMLPEERTCSTLNIPDENCLCLGSDTARNTTINADDTLFKRVFALVESRAVQLPCVERLEIHKNFEWISTYRMVEREQDKESADLEWLTINFYVKILKSSAVHNSKYGQGDEEHVWFKTMVRHYMSSGRLEYVEAVITHSIECYAVHLERLCTLCYSGPFWSLSSPGPNKGFLLDVATAVV